MAKDRKRREQLVEALLESASIDDASDYLRRGRAFEQIDLETLRAQWVDVIRRWSRDLSNKELVQRKNDLQSELGLRKKAPPVKLVQDELAAINRKVLRKFETLRDDPGFFDLIKRWLAERLKRQS